MLAFQASALVPYFTESFFFFLMKQWWMLALRAHSSSLHILTILQQMQSMILHRV